MPREHSQLFVDAVESKDNNNPPRELKDIAITDKLNADCSYSQISDLLREANDAQFGIVSTYDESSNAWIRDATRSIPLEERIAHDHPVIEANNALLRCLSRLRPIDYAISKTDSKSPIPAELKNEYAALSERILSIANDKTRTAEDKREQIKREEKTFNTLLVENLHTAGLAEGCKTTEDAEKLLFYYRNLSSVLEPARTLVTLTYDHLNKVFQRETQYPVIEKTSNQKEDILKLQEEPDVSKKLAMQQADRLFAELIARDDTALSAQARKTHVVGSKNAFIVKNELIQGELDDAMYSKEAEKDNTLWLGRMGSPVYVGKGQEEAEIQIHTRENLEQMRMAAQKRMGKDSINLHVTALNTYSPLENQSTIISHLYKATRDNTRNSDDVSYAPTNIDGTFRALDVSPGLERESERMAGISALQKADRLKSVSGIMRAAAAKEDTISLVNCASGQDRTGTAVEKATQDWMSERYSTLGLQSDNIQRMRAEGGNAAEITTHHIHGSPGMKTESMANNLFGKSKSTFSSSANREFYLKSAGTNKKNSVGDEVFLSKPVAGVSKTEFLKSCEAFKNSLDQSKDTKKIELATAGQHLLDQISIIAKQEPKKINLLKSILDTAHKCFNESEKTDNTKENVAKLVGLTQKATENKSSLWQKLGIGLAYFACAALVVAGIILAIPTGGLSLMVSAAAAACGSALAVTGTVGATALYSHTHQENKLSGAVGAYTKALDNAKQPSDEKQESTQEQGGQNRPSFK